MIFRCVIKVFLVSLFLGGAFTSSWACHQGGPMGFAKGKPGSFSLDISSSTIFPTASTSETSGCKNWDFIQLKTEVYIASQWDRLSESASQGQGEHLLALSQMMGCTQDSYLRFTQLVQQNYKTLFQQNHHLPSATRSHQFLLQLQGHLGQAPSIACSVPLYSAEFVSDRPFMK